MDKRGQWQAVAAKAAVGAAGKVAGKAAGAAKGVAAVSSAAGWVVAVGAQHLFDALSNASFVLFLISFVLSFGYLLGQLPFVGGFFSGLAGFNGVYQGMSIMFLFASWLIITHGRGLLLGSFIAAFWQAFGRFWWESGSLIGVFTQSRAALFFGFISLPLIIYFVAVLQGRSKGRDIKGIFAGELEGLLPLVIFLFDTGVLLLVLKTISVRLFDVFSNDLLIRVFQLPWWPVYFLANTQKSGSKAKNFIITFCWIFIGLWILGSVIGGVVSFQTFTNNPLIEAGQGVKAQISEQAQSEGLIRFVCSIKSLNSPGAFSSPGSDPTSDCVRERTAKLKAVELCKSRHNPNSLEYDTCVDTETERLKKPETAVQGAIDSSIIEFTKARFERTKLYTGRLVGADAIFDGVVFESSSPRVDIVADLSCEFKLGNESIQGVISKPRIMLLKQDKREGLLCQPVSDLKRGSWKVVFRANIRDLVTQSRQSRFIVGSLDRTFDVDEFEKLSALTDKSFRSSIAPNEFVRINFNFGEDEFITSVDQPTFVANVESVGKGNLLSISDFSVDVGPGFRVGSICEKGFSAITEDTGLILKKKDVLFNPSSRVNSVGKCQLVLLPELKNLESPELRDFIATIKYDYGIEQSFNVVVEGQ